MSMSSTFWQALPSWVSTYLGRSASHAMWERNLAITPLTSCAPQWQSIEEGTSSDEAVWGLQSVTFHTSASSTGTPWSGAWPELLPGANAKLQHTKECFGLPLVHDQHLAIFQIQSPDGNSWVAQCSFARQGQLESLTLVRMHDWIPLADNAPKPATSTVELPHTLAAPDPSNAGSPAPRTGWYEAVLPYDLAMREFYANSDIRLVYRTIGDSFPRLGVRPSEDEALVQWHWIRAE